MRLYFISAILLILNVIYSSFALKVAREHAKKVSLLKQQIELQSKLRLEIQSYINYKTARDYANRKRYVSIDWNRVKLLEPPSGK
ncbi:MAG: hypothetical protein NZL90_03690 [Aquificaceae bacterium]|nr:hypothetical protein [Aquificaceae bacterium]MDW8237147.1 hypothetical protein [Aquificaceae bacterium]